MTTPPSNEAFIEFLKAYHHYLVEIGFFPTDEECEATLAFWEKQGKDANDDAAD